jgi:hypothetical protein
VPEAETPTDVAILRAQFGTASKNGIRHVLSGGNLASEGILPVSWHYNARDTKYAHSILKFGNCATRHYRAMRCGLREEIYFRVIRGIKTLYPLNAVKYDKALAREELEQEFGWKYYGSKHGESRFTKFIQTWYLPTKHGIDYRRATFSSEICLGATTRQRALELLDTPPYDKSEVDEEVKYVAKKLGLGQQELEDIIKAPPKWYCDFPRDEALLAKVYDAYRFVMGQLKTSNF